MKTNRFFMLALAGTTFFAACKTGGSNALIGSWQATSMENDMMDEMVANQKKLLDTMGTNTSPADWPALYGTANLDSFKKANLEMLEMSQKNMKESAGKTRFTFRADSIALLRFEETEDSARWALEGDSLLVLTSLGAATPQVMKMNLQNISKDSLTLRFTERGATSRMYFRRITDK